DLDGDCVKDLGEPALSGWVINLQPGPSTTTDVLGNYYFNDVAPGTYSVTESQQSGWVQNCPMSGSYTVTVGPNQVITGKDFGNLVDNAASISGTKFWDENGNSVWDLGPEEVGVKDFLIKLDGTVSKTVTTNPQGGYVFSGLPPGSYTVQEVPWPYPSAQTYPLTVFHTVDNLQLGDHLTDYDFGNDTCDVQTTTYDTCLHGTDDNFSGPEPSDQSPGLIAYLIQQYDYIDNFDEPANNQHFGHTFNGCWDDDCVVVGATLRMKLRASGGGAPSDWMYLGDWTNSGRIYSISMNDLEAYAGGDGTWNNGNEMTVTLYLENLPLRGWLPTNILGALQDGNLDIIFEDETEVDFIEMTVELCCQPCYAYGDINDDGIALIISDLTYLIQFVNFAGPPPNLLYEGDLNGDCYIDQLDIDMFNCYLINGYSCFTNGYPVKTCCCPDTTRGACCAIVTAHCDVLSPFNCQAISHNYIGDNISCTPNPCPICCIGIRGNVDGDGADACNVADLTYLVDYLFFGGPAPPCTEEGDVNGDGGINVADLTHLVEYLFFGGPPPPSCGAKNAGPASKVRSDIMLNTSYEDVSTIITLESSVDLRGIQIELSGEQTGDPVKLVDDDLELFFHQKDGSGRIGILDMQGSALIQKGSHPLVRLPGKYEIVEAIVSDLNHNALVPAINPVAKGTNLPTEFALSQNYPNPFNP
ncbi:MAG: hypothetical protein KAT58_12555, partial [candidate division Zixibacteria bacterium]|nr:hypothetical protein [candidate division Zixibacteria bacterium]